MPVVKQYTGGQLQDQIIDFARLRGWKVAHFDEWRDFNLFRPDIHYFWFMTSPGLRLYNRFTGGRFADYDVCRLVAEKKPVFVSDRVSQLKACGLDGLYRPTRFDGLVERAAD